MPRKVYGSEPSFEMDRPLSTAGDPEFTTDAQNNDDAYKYDTDYPREDVRSD